MTLPSISVDAEAAPAVPTAGTSARMQTDQPPGTDPPQASQAQSPATLITHHAGQTRWLVPADLMGRLLDSNGLRLAEWQKADVVTVVKTGPHRTVYRIRLPGETLYLKHYKTTDWRSHVKSLLRVSKADLEHRAVNCVADLGIATVDVRAVGRRVTNGLVSDSYLLTLEIPAAIQLDVFVTETLPFLPEPRRTSIRQQLARELGVIFARLHIGGLVHGDLHSENLLVLLTEDDELRLWLIDLHPLHRHSRLSLKHVEESFAVFNNFFMLLAKATDRLRLLHAYWRELHRQPDACSVTCARLLRTPFAQLARRIEAYCHTEILWAWDKRDRKWARGNRHVIICDSETTECRGLAAIGQERLRLIRDAPHTLLDSLAVQRSYRNESQSSVAVTRLAVGPETVSAVCSVRKSRQKQRWPGALSRYTGGRRAWELGHALQRRGIPVAEPLLFVSEADDNRRTDYLVTREIADSITLGEFLRERLFQFRPVERRHWINTCVRELARHIRQMHGCGFEHKRLECGAILVPSDPEKPRVWFLRIDRVYRRRSLAKHRIVKMLDRLNASLPVEAAISRSDRLRFLRWYLQATFRADWKNLWQRVRGVER